MQGDPFVGRRLELDVLRRAIDNAAAGRGSLVLIVGEPGIGKSRLAAAISDHAASSGLVVRRAVCWEESSAPFWPWTQLLRDGLDESAPAEVRLLAGEAPADERSALEGDAEHARLALFDAVTRYLFDEASRTPVLLVIDDLHWADLPSLRLLAYLSRTLRDAAVVVVATFRDVEVDRGSEAARALGSVSEAADMIRLGGLQTGEVAELLAASAGALAPTEFARAIHERTGGNPLFVRELSRLLAAQGRHLENIANLPVPEGVHGVIRRRVARLSQPTQELLSVAAVFGTEFRADLVAHAAQDTKELTLSLLDGAIDARLVGVVDSTLGRYSFTHALVRDVLYDTIPMSQRAPMHLRAAHAIESLAPTDEHLAELAFHHLHGSLAGDVSRGIDFSVRAGRRSLERLAYEDAAAHFDRALTALEAAPDADLRTGILLELGDARLRAGDLPGARAAFEDAAELARRRARPEDLARAALGFGAGLGGFEVRLFDQRQIDLIEEALAALPEQDSPLRASLLARLTVALSLQESLERRVEVAERAVAMARRTGDERALASALAAHCDALAGPGDTERRIEATGEIVGVARTTNDRALELLGRRQRILALMEAGDMDAVDTEIELYASVSEDLRQPLYQWYVPLWRGMRSLMRGEFDQAFAYGEEVARIGDRAHSANARMLFVVQRFMVLSQLGRPGEANDAARAMVELMPGYGNPYFALSDAWLFAAAGDAEQARAALHRLPDPCGEWIAVDSEWLPSMCQLAFALSSLEERDAAAAAYEHLVPYRRRLAIEGIGAATHGSVEHHLGLLARTAGLTAAAIDHFEAALDVNRRIGARCLEGQTMRELASSLRLVSSDDARADELDARGRSILRELGVADAPDAGVTRLHVRQAVNTFRHEGELWTLAFGGEIVRVKDAKGLHDIARLLSRPGVEMAALDLVAEPGAGAGSAALRDLELGPPGHAGEILDDEARARYKARLDELEADIAEADTLADPAKAERARIERDELVGQLSAAYGLGGRPRRAGDPTERARTTVTRRIKDAIARISAVHPALGRHLRNSVRTGTFCSYAPEQPVDWQL